MRLFLISFLVVLAASAAECQSISPLVAECGAKKCAGAFTVTNTGIVPLSVSISAYAVTFDSATKNPVMHPLDASEHVKLSEMSARVPPRQPHDFAYQISCDTRPCLIGLAASMVVGHTNTGVQAKVVLIEGIYLCDVPKGCRASVRKAAGL